MSAPIEQKLDKIPVIRWVMRLLKTLKLPGLEGLTVYDLLEMYVLGLINGAVSIWDVGFDFTIVISKPLLPHN